jgi:PadR family transcriptional regulator PadR
MDIQLKRGVLEICILTILNHNDSYGYQIIKDAQPYINISESTLYPILKRLESNGSLTVYSVEHNSRLRKYYKITPIGQEKINTFLDDWKEIMLVYNFIDEEMKEVKHD